MKKALQEIHRRSLWQVLGAYVMGAWLVLQVVDTLNNLFELPEWARYFAVMLLVVGLPVVLATAFVQKGAVHLAADMDSDADATTNEDSLEKTRGGRGVAYGLFTWRRAIIGGVGGLALWGLVAAGPCHRNPHTGK